VLEALRAEPLSAFELVPRVYGHSLSTQNAHWLLSEVLGYLTHLKTAGSVRSLSGQPERWAA
jgi:hypothetical protein